MTASPAVLLLFFSVLQSRRGRPPAWGRSCTTGPCGQQLLSTESGPTPSVERRSGHARPMAFHEALRARRDRAARYWFGRAAREVSRDRGARSGERAVDVVTPGPPGRTRSTLRATLRAAPAAPSSTSASSGLSLLVPRPVRQLSVGASRAVSSRPDQDPSALRALRCGSSLGPVVPCRRSRPLSRALCRTGRGNGWQDTCSAVPPVPASAPVPGGKRHPRHPRSDAFFWCSSRFCFSQGLGGPRTARPLVGSAASLGRAPSQ